MLVYVSELKYKGLACQSIHHLLQILAWFHSMIYSMLTWWLSWPDHSNLFHFPVTNTQDILIIVFTSEPPSMKPLTAHPDRI